MNLLQSREKEIFETLKKIKKYNFVVIGGYAVNAYTLPRFSRDCDIVTKNNGELEKIERSLHDLGYHREKDYSDEGSPVGIFERFEKVVDQELKVGMDILIGEVLDRQTNVRFSADWIFDNSTLRNLRGKTISEQLKIRIINSDALFIMKLISCRKTDIRDILLLINSVKDKNFVREQVSEKYDIKNRLSKALDEINSEQFRDGLQGVFGKIDNEIFERNKRMIIELEK